MTRALRQLLTVAMVISYPALAWATSQCPPGTRPASSDQVPALAILVVGAIATALLAREEKSAAAVAVGLLTLVGFFVAMLVAGFTGSCTAI